MIYRRSIRKSSITILLVFILGAWAPFASAADRKYAATTALGGISAGSTASAEWKARFVQPDGRVIDDGNGGVSHSEGQGYGMLLAVAAADRPAFDQIWTWTQTHLRRRYDHLFAWRWDPLKDKIADTNNATDGDVLVAWALAEAADLWRSDEYASAGRHVARDIGRKLLTNAVGIGTILMPASYGFSPGEQPDGPVVNLSYWIFPALPRLAQLAPEYDWLDVERTGLKVLSKQASLPADWTSLAHGHIEPALRLPARYGYDALRIPLYLSLAGLDAAVASVASFQTVAAVSNGIPIVDLRTGQRAETAQGRGYRAITALLSCSLYEARYPTEFYRSDPTASYYPATLHLLAQIAALVRGGPCLDVAEATRLQPNGWHPLKSSLSSPASSAVLSAQGAKHDASQDAPRVAIAPPITATATPVLRDMDLSDSLSAGSVAAALIAMAVRFRSRRRDTDRPGSSEPAERRTAPPAPHPSGLRRPTTITSRRATERWIDAAVAAHQQWDLSVGIVTFHLADIDVTERCPADLDAVMSVLRGEIEPSDHLAAIGPAEIVICLSLLRDDRHFENRLCALAQASNDLREAKLRNDLGLSVCKRARKGVGAMALDQAHRARRRSIAVGKSDAGDDIVRRKRRTPKRDPMHSRDRFDVGLEMRS